MLWRTNVFQTIVITPLRVLFKSSRLPYALAHQCSPNHSLGKLAAGSRSKTTGFILLSHTTILQTILFISPLRGLIQKTTGLNMLWRTNVLLTIFWYYPAAVYHSKTTGFNMLWRTNVLQTIVWVSLLRGLVRKQQVFLCSRTPLFSKPFFL